MRFAQPALRALTLLALALITTACGAPSTFQTWTSSPEAFDTHSYWYDTGSEVVVFDAQFTPAVAEALIAEIQSETDSPITHVVVTHPNPDKFNGVTAFQAIGARAVASEATAAAIPGVHAYKRYYFVDLTGTFPPDAYPVEPQIDVTFSGRMTLELDGGAVELVELESSGVAATQTVAHVPEHNALVVGDLVHHRAHAWLEGGIVDGAPRPDLDGWRAALAELNAWSGAIVYGGRGLPAEVGVAVAAQTDYLTRMEQLVAGYIAGLDAAGRASLLAGDGAHWEAITQLAAVQFPEHQLAYMVTYGVYGLAQSMARGAD